MDVQFRTSVVPHLSFTVYSIYHSDHRSAAEQMLFGCLLLDLVAHHPEITLQRIAHLFAPKQ